jgi:protein-S-isoprenylcysteine O-methyltransferase Ste14
MRTARSIAEAPRAAKARSFAESRLTPIPITGDLRWTRGVHSIFQQPHSPRLLPVNSPETSAPPPSPRPSFGLAIGGLRLSGPVAVIVALLLVAAIVTLVVLSKPSLGMLAAAAIWIGFLVYWSSSAGRGTARKSQESAQSRALHQRLLNLGLLLLFVSIPGLRWPWLPPNSWHVWVGLGIMAAATLFHIWARRHLGRNWTTQVTILSDHQLVQSGPYRWIRHPIYTALVALAIGTAMVSGRVISLLGALMFAFAYVRKLRIEERALSAEFGVAWEEYRRRSWALLPPLF